MFTFIETRLFTRLLSEHLSDEEYLRLQAALVRDPEGGAAIPGSGGVRKLRWALPGRGKRGGLRVIYYLLLPAVSTRRDLDADALLKERRREHFNRRLAADSPGD